MLQQQDMTTKNELELFSSNVSDLIASLHTAEAELDNLKEGCPKVITEQLPVVIDHLQEIKDSGLKLAVFGGFCAGKSSLINALLGIDHLEVGVQVTTATLTIIKQAQDEESALVTYKSADTIARELFDLVKIDHDAVFNITSEDQLPEFEKFETYYLKITSYITEINNTITEKYLRQNIVPALLEYIEFPIDDKLIAVDDRVDWLSHRAHLKNIINIPDNIYNYLGTQIEIDLQSLREILSLEVHALSVEKVILFVKSDYLSGDIQIIDTPGLGSLYERHTRLSESHVRDVDVILYVLPSKGIGKEDVNFVSLLERRNEILNEDKVFFVSNMVDLNVDEDSKDDKDQVLKEINKHTELIKSDLNKRGIPNSRVFSVSAECAKWSIKAQNGELEKRAEQRKYEKFALWFDENDEPEPKTNLALSGIPNLTASLRQYLNENQIIIKKEKIYNQLGRLVEKGLESNDERRLNFESKEKEIQDNIENFLILKEELTSGYSNEKENTEIILSGYITELGTEKVGNEIREFLLDLSSAIQSSWEIEIKKGIKFESVKALGAGIVNTFFGFLNFLSNITGSGNIVEKRIKSELENRIERMIKSDVTSVMEKRRTREKLEKNYNDLTFAINHEIKESMVRVSKKLNTFQQKNSSGRNVRSLDKTSVSKFSTTLTDEAIENIGIELLKALGIGGGALVLDSIITMGFASVATVLYGFYKLSIDRASYIRKQNDEIKKSIEVLRPKIIQELVTDSFARYKKNIMSRYDDIVNTLLNETEDKLLQAKKDLELNQSERIEVEKEMDKADKILLLNQSVLEEVIQFSEVEIS